MVEYKNVHNYTINLGLNLGEYILNWDFDPTNSGSKIPCRVKVTWGNTTLDTGFRGSSEYNVDLNNLGYSNTLGDQTSGHLLLNKNEETPATATITLYTPIEESLAKITLECEPQSNSDSDSDSNIPAESLPLFNEYATNQIISMISGKNSEPRWPAPPAGDWHLGFSVENVQADGLYGLDLFLNYRSNINEGTNDDSESTINFVRNPNCWAYDIDLTCCSPWNMHPTLRQSNGLLWNGSNLTAGTLISPRHVIFCSHASFFPPVGSEMRFIAKDNTVVTRTLVNLIKKPDRAIGDTRPWTPEDLANPLFGAGDFTVGVLDSDVSENITFAKVLPDNWENKLNIASQDWAGYYAGFDPKILVVGTNQMESVFINNLGYYSGTSVFGFSKDTETEEFWSNVVLYDSGSPHFIIVDFKPILVMITGTPGAGTAIKSRQTKDKINNTMTQLGGGYQLTEADLSEFRTVPLPVYVPPDVPVPPDGLPSILYACNFVDLDASFDGTGVSINFTLTYMETIGGEFAWSDNFAGASMAYDQSDNLWKMSIQNITTYYSAQLYGQWRAYAGGLVPGLEQGDVSTGFISAGSCDNQNDSDSDSLN